MKIFLANQAKHSSSLLNFFKGESIISYDKKKLKEKATWIGINVNKELRDTNLTSLFDYNIFPKNIMTSFPEWQLENRELKKGDTILQQINLPPLKKRSLKIIFGVRVNEIINETERKGFSYETLVGHVEKGISTFTIERTVQKQLIFKIQTFSAPGNILTKILGPFFSIPYQDYCTRKALKNVKHQLEDVNNY